MDSYFSACRILCSYQERGLMPKPQGLDIRPLSYGFHKDGTKLSLTTSFAESLMCNRRSTFFSNGAGPIEIKPACLLLFLMRSFTLRYSVTCMRSSSACW